jgi:Secretion system C-terminal sorting domain/Ricin-type beta-trefoil lectin domain-like
MQNLKTTLSFFLLLFVLSFQISAQTLCQNPTNGGSIFGEQTICANTTPSTILNVNFPSGGGTGALEYVWIKWKVLPQSAPQSFTMIEGSNTPYLNPGPLSETTWFRRCSRRAGCDDYIAETNVIKVTVNNAAPVAICKNIEVNLGTNNAINISAINIDNGSTSACGNIAQYSLNQTTFTTPGSQSVTLTVTNTNGQQSTCSATINVLFEVPEPVFNLVQPTCTDLFGALQLQNLPAGYSTAIDNGNLTVDKTNYSNLTPGKHTLTVARGIYGSKNIDFTVNESINSTPAPTFTIAAGTNTVTLTNLPTDFYSQLDYGTKNINQTTYSGLSSGVHRITIGQNGCDNTSDFAVTALTLCEQVTNAGAIYPNQLICYGTYAGTIYGDDVSNNGTLAVEYSWITQSTDPADGDNYTEVGNSNQITFEPGPLCATFWYKRRVRVVGCTEWSFESNWVKVAVNTETTIRFVNQSGCAVKVYWVNGNEEVLYATLQGGAFYDQATYQGHIFRVRSASINTLITEYSAHNCDLNIVTTNAPCVQATYNGCGKETVEFKAGKIFRLINKSTGMPLEVLSGYNRVIQTTYNYYSQRQMWVLESAADGYFKLKNQSTGKYFQISSGSYYAGAYVSQGSATTGHHQQFSFEKIEGESGYVKIIARHSCLAVKLSSDCDYIGNRAIQTEWYSYDEHAKWELEEVYDFKAIAKQEVTLNARRKDAIVELKWISQSNEPVNYYVIERSADNQKFAPIQKIDNNNNPEEIQYFGSEDKNPLEGSNYYRVRILLANGIEIMTDTELVEMPTAAPALVIYPNPVSEKAFINLNEWKDKSDINIDFYDFAGLKIQTQFIGTTTTETVEVNINTLLNGAYTVLISAKDTRSVSQKIIVEKLD